MMRKMLVLACALLVLCQATPFAWAGWQRDLVCRGRCGGQCGPCGSGSDNRAERRRAAEEAAEAADAEAEAEERAAQQRYNEVYAAENAAYARKDYQEALRLALQRQELRDGPNVRAAIALYRGWLANDAGDYKAAIDHFEDTLSAHPDDAEFVENYKKWVSGRQKADVANAAARKLNEVAKEPRKPAPIGRLDFIDNTSKGIFGSNVSQPVLNPGDPNAGIVAGTDTNAAHQLKSVEWHSRKAATLSGEAAADEAQKGFDKPGTDRGGLGTPDVATPPSTPLFPVIPSAMADDQVLREGMKNLVQWSKELQQAKDDAKRAEAALQEAKDPQAKAAATSALSQAQAKSDGLSTAVATAKQGIEARKIYLEKVYLAPFKLGAATPPAQKQPPAPAPADQGAAKPGS